MDEGMENREPLMMTVFILRSGIFECGMPLLYKDETNDAAARTGHIILSPIESFEDW
jgi:hypothetical protein